MLFIQLKALFFLTEEQQTQDFCMFFKFIQISFEIF